MTGYVAWAMPVEVRKGPRFSGAGVIDSYKPPYWSR